MLWYRFAINLRHSEGGDIAFQLNPRPAAQVVVRNTKVGGVWQHEERDQPHFPFHPGQPCHIAIKCKKDKFKVSDFYSFCVSNFIDKDV